LPKIIFNQTLLIFQPNFGLPVSFPQKPKVDKKKKKKILKAKLDIQRVIKIKKAEI
jgi:hypothetical protein